MFQQWMTCSLELGLKFSTSNMICFRLKLLLVLKYINEYITVLCMFPVIREMTGSQLLSGCYSQTLKCCMRMMFYDFRYDFYSLRRVYSGLQLSTALNTVAVSYIGCTNCRKGNWLLIVSKIDTLCRWGRIFNPCLLFLVRKQMCLAVVWDFISY